MKIKLTKTLNTLLTSIVCLMALNIPSHAFNTTTYYHHDGLGSPVAATDETGNLKWREDYQPYGERVRKPTNAENNLWYTGKPEEPALGLQYFGARWYDPVTGRFTGIDPVGVQEDNIHTFNRYAYAANNPYVYVDPDGKAFITAMDVRQGESLNASVQRNAPGNAAAVTGGISVGTVVLAYLGIRSGAALIGACTGLCSVAATFYGVTATATDLPAISPKNVTKGVQANRAQGKVGEAITESTLKNNGSFAGKQVTFETSTGKRSVIDFVTNSKGGKGIVETKTGGAKLSSGQSQLFDDVQNGRPVIPRGKNAANAGLTPGKPTVIKSCGIDRPC